MTGESDDGVKNNPQVNLILARQPAPFDPDSEPRYEAWLAFKRDWKIYETLSKIPEESPEFQKYAFLDALGKRAREWARASGADEEKDTLEEYQRKVEVYVGKASAEIICDYRFWNRDKDQQAEEPFDGFLERLRRAAQDCKFGLLTDRLIRSRIVIGVRDAALQRRLLSDTQELDLEKMIDKCRSFELGAKSADLIRSGTSGQSTSRIGALGATEMSKQAAGNRDRADAGSKRNCGACGLAHANQSCPAEGRKCSSCNGYDHYARVCPVEGKRRQNATSSVDWRDRSRGPSNRTPGGRIPRRDRQPGRKVWILQEEDESGEDVDFSVGAIKTVAKIEKKQSDRWEAVVKIANRPVRCKLDTGAEVSCIPMTLARDIMRQDRNAELRPVSTRLCSYFGDKYPCRSSMRLSVRYLDTKCFEEFYVLDMNVMPTLSGDVAETLKMIARVSAVGQIANRNASEAKVDPVLESYMSRYPEVFKGEGRIRNHQCQIVLKQNYVPVVNSCRLIPVAFQEEAREELRRMKERGIITEVHEPTEFVSHIVLAKKANGKIRLCLDPTHLNRAIERSHHPMKRFEQISAQMSGAKYFSTLDAREGFWQIALDERSSRLCTFITQWGRFRFLRMPYGISCASDEFQRLTDETFAEMPGVAAVVDDVIVWADTKEEHERRLEGVIRRCAEVGMVLNPAKCALVKTSVSYLGHTVSSAGVSLDESRADDIRGVRPPRNLRELQAFLGMTNFVSAFIHQYANLTLPLRELLKKDTVFMWEERHQEAFKRLKDALSSAPVLRFYDPKKTLVLSVDASLYGVGAVLLQEGRPIAYASRSLNETQKRYAQIEREMLAIVFGCTKFHYFVYGQKRMVVESDHRPLQDIMQKPLHQIPLRLQKMRMTLQRYDINVTYKKGAELVVADYLSRHPSERVLECEPNVCLIRKAPVEDHRLREYQNLAREDSELRTLAELWCKGWPENKSEVPEVARVYWSFRDEIHVENGLVMRADRVVIARRKRQEVLSQLHAAHSGVTKMKLKARSALYWPAMAADIENFVARCDECQKHRTAHPKQPMVISEIPRLPWQIVYADLFEYAGRTFLIVVDAYSFFWEIRPVRSQTCKSVLTALFEAFQSFGLPACVKSDNGPCFRFEFSSTLKSFGIDHITSSPYYPKGNSLAERAVREAKKILSRFEYGTVQYSNAVLMWRNTPRSEALGSPAQRLMGRNCRTQLPATSDHLQPRTMQPEEVERALREERERQKSYYTARNLPPLREGETVTVFDPREEVWKRGRIIRIASQPRSYMTQDTESGTVSRRNRQVISKVPSTPPSPQNQDFVSAPTTPTPSPPSRIQEDAAKNVTVGDVACPQPRRSERLQGKHVTVKF